MYKAACLALKRFGPAPGKEGESLRVHGRRRALLLSSGNDLPSCDSTIDPLAGPYDALLAGMLGGYVVFGGRSPRTGKISSVGQQICIYVFARVVLALARLAVKPGYGLPGLASPASRSAAISYYAWPVFAAGSWGMVMWLFRWHAAELQPSLRSSMNYIYVQSEEWDGLRNLVWHNK